MDKRRRAKRDVFRSLAPARAIEMVKAFQLRPEEEKVLIEMDIMGRSLVSLGDEMHISRETVARIHRKALEKIVNSE